MKATVDKETCIACGLCVSVCPECFEIAEDGKAEFIVEDAPESANDEVKEAVEACPVVAISIVE